MVVLELEHHDKSAPNGRLHGLSRGVSEVVSDKEPDLPPATLLQSIKGNSSQSRERLVQDYWCLRAVSYCAFQISK